MKNNDWEKVEADLKRRRIPPEVKKAVEILLQKKAEKIIVLKLKDAGMVTDYMIICHGNSTRQTQALADQIQEKLRQELRLKPFSTEGERASEWILLDYIDFIIHIFMPETRKKYSLEKLWMDAKRYDFYPDQ